MATFDQSCARDVTYYICQGAPCMTLEESMENYADLMQRLLEIQSGERRSPKLIEEDQQLMRSLHKKSLAGKPMQKLGFSGSSPEQEQFKA
jgi:hypothetical protein